MVMDVVQIGIFPTGETWDLVEFLEDGNDVGDAEWFEVKSDAIKAGRKLFAETPTAKSLIVQNLDGRNVTVRSR